MKDKEEPTPDEIGHDEIQEIEDIMGPMPEFLQAGADLQQINESKSKSEKVSADARGHGFRKKKNDQKPQKSNNTVESTKKSSKIAVTFGDDSDESEATAKSNDEAPAKPATKKGIVVKDFADEAPEPQEEQPGDTKDEGSATDGRSSKSISVTSVDDVPEKTQDTGSSSSKIVVKEAPVEEEAESADKASSEDAPSAPPVPKSLAKNLNVTDDSSDYSPLAGSVKTTLQPKTPIKSQLKPVTPVPVQPVVQQSPIAKPLPRPVAPVAPQPPLAKPVFAPRPEIAKPNVPQKAYIPPPNPRAPIVTPVSTAMPYRPQPVQSQKPLAQPPVSRPSIPQQSPPQQPTVVPPPQITARPQPRMTQMPPRPVAPQRSTVIAASPKIKKSWTRVFKTKTFRWLTLFILLFGLLGVGLSPSTRYPILNMAGVRVAASLVILDDKTSLPLKNISVKLQDKSATTDENGKVAFEGLKLGRQSLIVEKTGFEKLDRVVTLGWGSNPLGDYRVNAVGAQYQFVVKDWLSQKPIGKAEVISGASSAFTDGNGIAMLTVDKEVEGEMEIAISANGYRTEKRSINAQDKEEHQQILVPSKQHYFVSKRTGKYDVYKVDIDGKNEELVVAGTGIETEDIKLIPHPTKPIAALVATRENERNKDGFLISGLYVIDFTSKELEKVTKSERIEIISWLGDNLVYAKIADGASNTDPKRHRLMSYNTEDGSDKEIAASNYFNDILALDGFVYYAPSNAFQENPNAQLYRVKPDGSEQTSIVNKEVWNLFRTTYESVDVMQHEDWYRFNIGDTLATKQATAPTNPKHRIYVDGPVDNKSLWIDERDGKGVLLLYEQDKKQDTELFARSGLTYPVRWLNEDYIVFRVANGTEQADYVMYVGGKEPIKVRDVSNSSYIGRWYYY
jgi:hypothetical protein